MKQQIVIADDDRDMRRGLELRARKWGYDVICVDDGEAACEVLLPQDGPTVAILDRHMPSVDGVEVCTRVRKARPEAGVFLMMLTGRNAPEDIASALNSGANDYVSKPFNDTELRARLDAGSRSVQAVTQTMALARIPAAEDPGEVLNRVLQGGHLVPEFDPHSMQYDFGVLNTQLKHWEGKGDVSSVVMDRIKLCPQCESLPTFRDGCPDCGSARIDTIPLIHHFRCGFVAERSEFERPNGVACPKCLAHDMIVGADFEHVNGPYRCIDCSWSGVALESIGQCLQCSYRFPDRESVVNDLVGYHVERMDLLADYTASH